MRRSLSQRMRIASIVAFVSGMAAISSLAQSGPATARVAQGRQPAASGPAVPAAGEISLAHSRVFIHVDKVGFGHEHAVVGQLVRGTVHLGAAQNAGVLEFDMRSMQADTADARKYLGLAGETSASTQEQVNANMLGKDVLDVATYPTALFTIDSAQAREAAADPNQPQYELTGKFTLHGTQRPLRIIATVTEEKNGYLHLRSGFKIRQTDYGIKPFSKALGAVGVADELTIYGDAWLRKEGS